MLCEVAFIKIQGCESSSAAQSLRKVTDLSTEANISS